MGKFRWCLCLGLLFSFLCVTVIFADGPVDQEGAVQVPPMTEIAMQYYKTGNLLWIVEQVVPIVLLAAILMTGASARIRDVAKKWG
jgi:hypothetical protein